MAEDYFGTIIEESLSDTNLLKKLIIVKTRVENVVEKHKTPWLKKWTLHTVKIPGLIAEEIANDLSKVLESEHNWYADYKNSKKHFIIFRGKIFKIDRKSKEQYDEAKQYGISLGIPPYQVDFSPEIK